MLKKFTSAFEIVFLPKRDFNSGCKHISTPRFLKQRKAKSRFRTYGDDGD